MHARAEHVEFDAGLPDAAHQHERDDRREQREVDLAVDAERRGVGRRIEKRVLRVVRAPVMAVERVENREQRDANEEHRQREMQRRPEEADAVQKAEKERRIAERRERAARVRDEKDKEHDDMHGVLAVVVRAQERPDQQHGRARRAHDARERGAEREQSGIEMRRAVQIAAHANAARHRIERGEQNDERHILFEQRVDQHASGRAGTERERERRKKRDGPCRRDLAEVVVPQLRRDERKHGDGQQNADKGDAPRGR